MFETLIKKAPWNVRLKILRDLRGWTSEQAANAIGCHRRNYTDWENGKFKPMKLYRKTIAKVYEIPEDEIFGQQAS